MPRLEDTAAIRLRSLPFVCSLPPYTYHEGSKTRINKGTIVKTQASGSKFLFLFRFLSCTLNALLRGKILSRGGFCISIVQLRTG